MSRKDLVDALRLGAAFIRTTKQAYETRYAASRRLNHIPAVFVVPPHGQPCESYWDGLRIIHLHVEPHGIPGAERLALTPNGDLLITSMDQLPYVCHAPLPIAWPEGAHPSQLQLRIDQAVAWGMDQACSLMDMTLKGQRFTFDSAMHSLDPDAPLPSLLRARLLEIRESMVRALQKAWSDTRSQPTPRNVAEAICHLDQLDRRVYNVRLADNLTARCYLWLDPEGHVRARGLKRHGQPPFVQIGRRTFDLDALYVAGCDLTPRTVPAIETTRQALLSTIDSLNRATKYAERWQRDQNFGGEHLRVIWANEQDMLAAGWVDIARRTGEISIRTNPTARAMTDTSGDSGGWKILKATDAYTLWETRRCTAQWVSYDAVPRQ